MVYGGNTTSNNNSNYRGGQHGGQGGRGGRAEKRGDKRFGGGKDEMEQRILDIARVTRVMKGGKRMSFRACVVLGDKKGNIGTGLGKGADVTMAVNKAVNQAKKRMIMVNMINDTIPHEVRMTIGAASIMFKPAQKGRGVIAGGVVRVILELAGVKNVTSKILGTNNKINNANCTIEALKSLRKVEKKVKGVKPAEKEVVK
ncbi:30S ribosomal protein S5 [Candidatus Falkowbacteria bacterium CG10_big_fil_rev_8_21_14_0_10_39_9]|uniref:Small ribosomal subunit protein uS5 n=1 Tax=Candidatus Falkowbacteria bacterium CG10_big_fil_rev_8_21_14_0_10_39_9 TaxID=1974566 RepID=A0A2M6WNX4_9BACT|nr:MAG: 30S ribosomal protein S5 [Candidatus Falkowbacteria bacterium CG10_big_fil_rev_8_21_14_0_10_39_9]